MNKPAIPAAREPDRLSRSPSLNGRRPGSPKSRACATIRPVKRPPSATPNRDVTGPLAMARSAEAPMAPASPRKPQPMRPATAWSIATAANAGVAKATSIESTAKKACSVNQCQAPRA
ncbi:MAG: hypothetical protein OXL38_11500 [Gammaproteobacteria bacterium]|nr:hypothetical protein [Gammaproteobacteria bacterium]